jgi:site-specific DNA-adenine methylase
MILTRLGNKRAIAHKIVPHFPKHDIESFIGFVYIAA